MVNVIEHAPNESTAAEVLNDLFSLVGVPGKDYAMGGGYEGAKRFDRDLASWNPPLNSADMDILPEKDLLDARTRDTFRNDAYVQGGSTLHKDGIVGSCYFLNAKPELKVLGRDETWGEAFQEEVEALFYLWGESPRKWVDASRKKTFTAMVRLGVGVGVTGGEMLATVEWLRDRGREMNTAIQMIDTDRLSTPTQYMWDQNVRAGVKMNQFGAPQSYFIRVRHQHDIGSFIGDDAFRWKEVAAEKPWGRQQVIHIFEENRVDQTRAIADIVAGLKEIAITRKFRDVTLQSAVYQAMYAATIESELPPEAVYQQLGGGGTGQAITEYAEEYLAAISAYTSGSKHMKLNGLRVPHLFPGTKFKMQPAGTPGGVGQGFEQSLLRYIATALNVSYEELSRDYSKTNYSSARAAMANTWKHQQARKRFFADAFADSIYRAWLEEAIQKDMLKTFPASEAGELYTDGNLNLKFEALAGAEWIGAARGQIDELKETQAAVLRIKYGLSTHEDELSRLGKDWRKVYIQLERERKERELRGIELYEDNGTNAASGTPRENEDNNEAGDGDKDAA